MQGEIKAQRNNRLQSIRESLKSNPVIKANTVALENKM